MAASIESLLKDPRMAGADHLVLQAGKNPTVVNSSGATELTRTQLSPFDIFKLLSPIIPEDKKAALMSQPTTQFQVNVAGAGQFDVVVSKEGGAMKVLFKPMGGAPASAPPTAPPPSAPRPPMPPSSPSMGISALPSIPSSPPSMPQRPAPPQYTPPTPPTVPSYTPPPQPYAPPPPPAKPNGPPSSGVQLKKRGPLEIDKLFQRQLDLKASDMHLSAGVPPMLRLDGDMVVMEGYPNILTPEDTERILWELMPDKSRDDFNKKHDADFAYEFGDQARFRCNIFMDRKGMGGVFRVIPSKILTAESLGLSPEIMKLCFLTKGLVLVTGPTGSGKSTTLCAMVDYINRMRTDHIITIEDPIEFVHENKKCLINQREVHNHTESFKNALRAALREDPDIVLVGEMRDLETIAIAIETAETGHLVFGTLHTSTAPSTVDRIIDQFPADRQAQIRVMLSESLKGVIAQTLLKKKGGGRVAALEVLICDSGIANLIREGKTFQIPSAMQTGKLKGNVMLNDALMELVRRRIVEPQEAYLKAVDKTSFESILKRNNVDTSFLNPPPLIPTANQSNQG
ncbi:MAG: type IV pilus twitching motility protein PilT [Blastocatellia bacterium]|nr:type IV pilus twitching motility protein PilT [Blastocatellia bacterium]